MRNSLGPSPARRQPPQHAISVRRDARYWRAQRQGELLAESHETVLAAEGTYEDVNYFPRKDVCRERLLTSSSKCVCPFKVEASYAAGCIDAELMDIGWFYPQVYDEVVPFAGLVAFYLDHVELQASGAIDFGPISTTKEK